MTATTIAPRRRPAAWAVPPFRRLAVAWFATNVGDSALYLMVAVWMKDLTGSDGAAAVVFAMLALSGLASPFLGHIADRVSRRTLMIVSNVVAAALVAVLLLVSSATSLWLVYCVMFCYGAVGYLTAGAQSGLLKDMLPDEHLASGNGVLSVIDQALRLISPLIGTGLYAWVGPRAVVVLTMTCFVITALVLIGVRVEESAAVSEEDRETFRREVSAGVRHLARTPVLRSLTILFAVAFGAAGLLNVAIFPVIEDGLGLSTSTLGMFVSLQGIGAVAGGLGAASIIARMSESPTFAGGLTLIAAGATTFLSSNVVAVALGIAAIGAGVSLALVAFVTLRQRLTPARLQGRTAAATNFAVNVPQASMTLLGAALLGAVDYRWLIAATVAAVALAAALVPRARSD